MVIVAFPCGQLNAGLVQRAEQGVIELFISELAVEAFDKPVLGGLSRCNVVPLHGSVRNLVRGAIVITRRESHGYRERSTGSAFGWSRSEGAVCQERFVG